LLLAQHLYLATQPVQFLAILGGQSLAFAGIYVVLLHPVAQGFGGDAQLRGHLGDGMFLVRGTHQPDGLAAEL